MAGRSVARIVGYELERIAAIDPRYFELSGAMQRLVDVLALHLRIPVPQAIDEASAAIFLAISGTRSGR